MAAATFGGEGTRWVVFGRREQGWVMVVVVVRGGERGSTMRSTDAHPEHFELDLIHAFFSLGLQDGLSEDECTILWWAILLLRVL